MQCSPQLKQSSLVPVQTNKSKMGFLRDFRKFHFHVCCEHFWINFCSCDVHNTNRGAGIVIQDVDHDIFGKAFKGNRK